FYHPLFWGVDGIVANMAPRDSELLQRYYREKSEDAFTQLVERHLALVYAVALRQAPGEMEVAERSTQAVFTGLAEEAESLQKHPSLTGWLYSRAQGAEGLPGSQRLPRSDASNPINASSSPHRNKSSEQLDPVIEEAIDKMDETDRKVLLL